MCPSWSRLEPRSYINKLVAGCSRCCYNLHEVINYVFLSFSCWLVSRRSDKHNKLTLNLYRGFIDFAKIREYYLGLGLSLSHISISVTASQDLEKSPRKMATIPARFWKNIYQRTISKPAANQKKKRWDR